jgi:flagellar basal-body rod modification protein FlgD
MAISSVSSGSSATSSAVGKTKDTATHQSNFMTLLVAQLRNQDPLNPTTNEDFIAQLAQLESLDETKKISTSLSTMVSSQDFSSASTLIGKNVSGVTNDAAGNSVSFNGTISSVSQESGNVKLKVTDIEGNVLSVTLDDIIEISQ